ncbi:hypothetical protein H4R20_006759 [Coemansia guatemalensis]|uniref:Uncharacterized protein n=1 Tax=Coemansia guatemalensis TaxID=2761395 RepID=A0A9W8HT41_9FUNG|nr:hypothetical protein H4R20_006759 [Coemansia guatemalensis]
MGIFGNRGGGDSTRTAAATADAARAANGISSRSRTVRGANGQTTALRRRRRSVDNFKDAQYALESSDDEPADDGRTRRNSNAGMANGADADGSGFPAIDGYTVVGRIGE